MQKKETGVNKSWQWQNGLCDQTCDYQMPKEIVTTLQYINKQINKLTNKKKYFLRRIVNLSSGIMWFPLNVLRFQKNQIIAQPLTGCILIQGL